MATPVQIVVTLGAGAGRAVTITRGVRKLVEREGHAGTLQVFRTLGELVVCIKIGTI